MSKIKKKKTCSLFYVIPKLAYEKKFISDNLKIYWYTRWNHETLASKCIAFSSLSRLCIKMGFSTSTHQTKTAEVSGWKHWRKVRKCHNEGLNCFPVMGCIHPFVFSVLQAGSLGIAFTFTLSTEIAIVNYLAVGGAWGGTRESQTSWASHSSPVGTIFPVFIDSANSTEHLPLAIYFIENMLHLVA